MFCARSCPAAILFTLLFFSESLSAHEFEPAQATVTLYSSSELGFSLDVDLIELVGDQFDIDAPAEELIASVRAMNLANIVEAIDAAKSELQEQVNLYVDGEIVQLEAFGTASALWYYRFLQQDPNKTNYRASFTSFATFSGGSELQARFAESMGTVSLVVTSPSQVLLSAGELSNGYLLELGGIQGFSSKVATAVNYTHHGFLHVLPRGLDHILFVVALCLLSIRTSTLVWQISVFTIAHTLTLGLSSAGLISVPNNVVEPIIALSIAWVAIENLITKKLHYWRILVVFLFGLIHGLGFASVLKDLGLSASQWLTSLIFFNVGVELGQIAVVILTLGVLYWWRERAWYRNRVQTPLCLAIAATGLFWAVQRVM